ncbi:DUF742 domain-containing protein [Streptomyces pacificus]|uniref:DUF742 domain-containing protein n=1 Tax=Streptomyces pacificus TaxID=2705029 RepID=A0A6A0B097_9ACTN|nr:DUF742 domain-containing protein [Streptomyces pacificus]GFH38556.1 DUF742 domain-containing protein [Streptomyces pacificus]
MNDHWYEDETGSMVRPYTVTRGRTRPAAGRHIDLMSQVKAVERDEQDPWLDHARTALLELVRRAPRSVAEIAADADMPLAVVRVLLADLAESGLVRVFEPPAPRGAHDPSRLREIADRLREI